MRNMPVRAIVLTVNLVILIPVMMTTLLSYFNIQRNLQAHLEIEDMHQAVLELQNLEKAVLSSTCSLAENGTEILQSQSDHHSERLEAFFAKDAEIGQRLEESRLLLNRALEHPGENDEAASELLSEFEAVRQAVEERIARENAFLHAMGKRAVLMNVSTTLMAVVFVVALSVAAARVIITRMAGMASEMEALFQKGADHPL